MSQLDEYLSASPFAAGLGMSITARDSEARVLRVSMPFSERAGRTEGATQFHGGAILGLVDTAATFALIMAVGRATPTVNVRTDFLRPASDTSLHATARVRSAGRTLGLVDVDVEDDGGRLVAVGRGTFAIPSGD